MLFEHCPWASTYQSKDFVATWYAIYGEVFSPVLVTGSSPNGQLIGLLVLAVSRASGELVVAGAHHAEYQGWLALPEFGGTFIEKALAELRAQSSFTSLCFRYLPPLTPLDWTTGKRRLLPYFTLEPVKRPLMNVRGGGQLNLAFRKANSRSKLNRMKQVGEVRLRRIADSGELDAVFDEISTLYDARMGAVCGSHPFQHDPLKRRFHLAMMDVPNLLHVTVLEVGNRIASAQLNFCDRDNVVVGVAAYSPFLAKQSPGKLHLYLLGQQLSGEGFANLDLTPSGSSGSSYKDRFATHYDTLHRLTFFFNRAGSIRDAVRRKCRSFALKGLQLVGIPAGSATRFLKRVRRIPSQFAGQIFRRLWSTTESRIYAFDPSRTARLEESHVMSRDAIRELLAFEPRGRGRTTQEFDQEAWRRLESGECHVYTCVQNGRLVHSGWLLERPCNAFLPPRQGTFPFHPESAVLFDFYTHPQARAPELQRASLCQMLHDAATITGVRQIYLCTHADDMTWEPVVSELGFTSEARFWERGRMGWLRRGSSSRNSSRGDGAFPAESQ
jgi:CelD/BcsL family acetyltransferase involved in cellulose biosynthesis